MGTYTTPEGPPLVQAASLALALLRAAKTPTWVQLCANPERLSKVDVDPDQLELMNAHAGPLGLLRATSPALTLAVCPACGLYTAVNSSAPSSCPLTLGCPGKPVRVTAAAKPKPPAKKSDAPTADQSPATVQAG